jgi:hypothetical protein
MPDHLDAYCLFLGMFVWKLYCDTDFSQHLAENSATKLSAQIDSKLKVGIGAYFQVSPVDPKVSIR